MTRWAVRAGAAVVLIVTACLVAGCGLFGGDSDGGGKTSVFDIKVGECFNPPEKVQAQISDVTSVDCSSAHTQEAYAIVPYKVAAGSTASTYPGDAVLKTFANGACAQQYAGYVGVNYLDSTLFFTYLLPSARGWEQNDDRDVVCFVTTTGKPLTASVKGTKQ
jgi:hypothetical protein